MRRRRIIQLAFALLLLCGGSLCLAQQRDSDRWLTVEVTDAVGQPLKQACVTFVPKEGEIVFRKADARGRVRLKRPEADRYRVVVKVDGYEAQKREVVIGSKSETVAFALQARANR